ncbi:hypothetical protein NQ315_016393 [Exocentrus adspersus]|uniref:Uncharacterized protein n=1 Tax=Exocentrus adspersus TaxID=1586481 RepID=A0AAV8VPV9_9CUCU|nr:hypothetical protein NQ315_016393 [Exocentrus adspersus]
MEMETFNMNLLCRTCKCVNLPMRPLFEGLENPHQSPRIDEMLMACASVQVMCGDGLPGQICQMCLEQLKNAFYFKRQVEKTDASLREYAKNLKVNEIKQELQNSDFMESLNTLNNLLNEQSSSKMNQDPSAMPVVPKIETDYIQFLDNNQMLLTCRECAKMFTTLEGLRCHKRIHSGEMYKCKQCDKAYTRLNHLQRHEQSHARRKVHVCRICSKTLTRMEHLKRHLITHLREKPFSCSTCNRGFNRIEHLQNHTPRCKGDTVYPCDICNKAFNREDSLEVHKTTHDNQQPKLPTIDNLDNIEDHYYQIDQDADTVFSDHSEQSDVDDCFEPQVEVTESLDDDRIKEVVDVSLHEEDSIASEASVGGGNDIDDIPDMETSLEKAEEGMENENVDEEEESKDVKVEEEISILEAMPDDEDIMGESIRDAGEDSGDSTDSEYLPKKLPPPKLKRGRGRPRKNPDAPPRAPKMRVPGRGRGRPPKHVKKEEKDEEYGEFPCPACQEMFNTMSSLDRHARIKHEGLKVHKCGVCNKEFSRTNHLKRHLTSHSTAKPFRCKVCSKSFNRRDHLNQHQKLHERSNDFECDICQKTFNRADHLAKHKASKHGIGEKIMGEKKYECPLCHKSFTTEKYRDVHVSGHNGQKEYQCRVCEKTFLSKSHLTEHMKFHNEHAKKFLCSECGQRFIRNDYLVIHMRRHRGEKPFKCKYCGKGFPRTTDLTVHERYHTGEKTHLCTICGRGFGRAYNLTVHMRTHTGEKPYQCTYCDAAFAQGNDLKAHVRRHTGERFQCELCSDSFLMGYLLTQHKRTVHGLNVVSNIRRLQPVHKQENPDEPPPITIPLPKPVVPDNVMFNAMHYPVQANTLHAAQLAVAQSMEAVTAPQTINIYGICRTCKGTGQPMRPLPTRPLFSYYKNLFPRVRICDMLMACASIEISHNDGLPVQICGTCLDRLAAAYIFKRQCERTDVSLRQYVQIIKNSDYTGNNTRLVGDESSNTACEPSDVYETEKNDQTGAIKIEDYLDIKVDVLEPSAKRMSSEPLNMDDICRTCKSTAKPMQSLFQYHYENLDKNHRIDDMLMSCASIQVVYDDSLPAQICTRCLEQLVNAFAFKCLCERTDESLRLYVKNVKNEDAEQKIQSPGEHVTSNLFMNQTPSLMYQEETVGVVEAVKIEETLLHPPVKDYVKATSDTESADETKQLTIASRPKKRLKLNHLDVETKESIVNIYMSEFHENLTTPLVEIKKRVAAKVGVSVKTVFRVVKEYNTTQTLSAPKTRERKRTFDYVNEFEGETIRRTVHQYFFKNETPTIEKILKNVNDNPELPNFKKTTFYKLLKKLNFKFQHHGRNSMLSDKDEIRVWRREYLEKVKQYRSENRKIYYLDELWISEGNTTSSRRNRHSKSLNNQSCQKTVICHIGNEEGFVSGAQCSFGGDEIDGDTFQKWFSKVLPALEENSVIIMDTAPYHTQRLEKFPTSACSKSAIQDWLRTKNIHTRESMLKVQLLALVNEYKKTNNKYAVDEMAKEQSKTVLRLPPYHCELNPFEQVWVMVRNYVAARKSSDAKKPVRRGAVDGDAGKMEKLQKRRQLLGLIIRITIIEKGREKILNFARDSTRKWKRKKRSRHITKISKRGDQ